MPLELHDAKIQNKLLYVGFSWKNKCIKKLIQQMETYIQTCCLHYTVFFSSEKMRNPGITSYGRKSSSFSFFFFFCNSVGIALSQAFGMTHGLWGESNTDIQSQSTAQFKNTFPQKQHYKKSCPMNNSKHNNHLVYFTSKQNFYKWN